MKKIIYLFLLPMIFTVNIFAQETVKIDLVPGTNWVGKGKVAIITIEVEPSFAFWLTDKDGNYIDTIYVTEKVAKSLWNGTDGREEALPVWGHARGIKNKKGAYLPSRDEPLPDAISSATPMEPFFFNWTVPNDLKPGRYKIRFEINLSFDFNRRWVKGRYSDKHPYRNKYNGQPSLIYEAVMTVGETLIIGSFQPIGCGSSTGKTGEIYPMDNIDSAFEIIKSISAK